MASSSSISAEYLGWKPTNGLCGRQFVSNIASELQQRRASHRYQLKRHVLEFNKRKLRLWEMDSRSRGRSNVRYPSVPVEDITFALQEDATDSSDPLVFTLILHGFNEESERSVHAHVWRGFSLDLVTEFVGRLNRCLTSREHLELVRQLEWKLVDRREVLSSGYFNRPKTSVDGGGGRPSASPRSSAYENVQQQQQQQNRNSSHSPQPPGNRQSQLQPPSAFSSAPHQQQHQTGPAACTQVTEELKQKLKDSSGAPLLHPPCDYDTLSRSHGNVLLRRTEQYLRTDSKAPTGAYIRRSELRDDDDDYEGGNNKNNGGGGRTDAFAAAVAAAMNGDGDANGGDDIGDVDPPPDYDNSAGEDEGSSGTGTLDSSRNGGGLDASFVSSSGRSSISDHSADPARGFSTWRRRRAAPAAQRYQLPPQGSWGPPQ